jgi:hypothetical protein
LLDLRSSYQEAEKISLAKDTEHDLIYLTRFISNITDKSFGEIERSLVERTAYCTHRQFRHLDKALAVRDIWLDEIEHISKEFNRSFSEYELSRNELEEMTDFSFENSLFIIPFGIYNAHRVFNEGIPFSYTELYICLSNLAVGLESFLRTISNDFQGKKTMKPLIDGIFQNEKWRKDFDTKYQELQQKYGDIHAILFIWDVLTDSTIDEFAKIFLISYKIRNYLFHTFTLQEELYNDLYSKIYTSICFALLYSWKFATMKGIIKR